MKLNRREVIAGAGSILGGIGGCLSSEPEGDDDDWFEGLPKPKYSLTLSGLDERSIIEDLKFKYHTHQYYCDGPSGNDNIWFDAVLQFREIREGESWPDTFDMKLGPGKGPWSLPKTPVSNFKFRFNTQAESNTILCYLLSGDTVREKFTVRLHIEKPDTTHTPGPRCRA